MFLGSAALAGELPTASPSEVGMSRLERLTQFFKADTDAKRLPGAVVMIARHGKVVYYEAFGVRDPATGAPMQKDSIFRIYSMTKPITGVAVLMLMEEGKLRLSDPISKYLPALKNPKVMVETVDAQGRRVTSTVPANREITIQDLLRHTSGITYGAGNSAAEQAMRDAGLGIQLGADKEPLSTRMTDQQLVEELGKLPLMFQPGTSWEYGRSIDVLLALVEKVSGQRADQFFQERIFQPLGMTDTFFNVPPDKLDRVAQPGPDPDTHETAKLTDVTKTAHLSGRRRGIALNRIRLHAVRAHVGERRRAEWHKVAVAEDGRADGLRPSWPRALARAEIRSGAGLWLRADCGCADATWHGPVSWQRRRIQLGRRGRHSLLGGSEGAIGADHAYSGTGSAAVLPARVSRPSLPDNQ